MKIAEVVLESRGSQVDRLKDKLLAAKKAGRKLDYDAIDRMMRVIAGNGKAELERLHHDFVKKCGSIPDTWIKRQKITTENEKYLGPTDKVKINKDGWQIPLNKRGFGV